MAKVKRSVLKEIVKECLLEILFEGIDSESGYEEEEPIREARQPNRRAPRPSPTRDLAAAVQQTHKKTARKSKSPRRLKEAPVAAAVSELTDDPTMAAIFADTAQTTLQEQREGRQSYKPADSAASKVQSTDDLGDLFEGAGNWAALAFGEADK